MFRTLTVSREYGSGGSAIAQRVAERLNWKLYDRALIEAIARAGQVEPETAQRYDERVDSWMHRVGRRGLWHGALESVASVTELEFFDAETMAALAREVIEKAADKGDCVIVGRGAQCVLQDRADTLHVFIYAPWTERVARIREKVRSRKDVDGLVRETDQKRAEYIRLYFGRDWRDEQLYQLMVDSQLGEDAAAGIIVEALDHGR